MKMIRVIGVLFIVLLLFSACSRGDESSETKQPTVISIYVYTPDKPMVTRGDIGTVAPIDNTIKESTITKLQIWIFQHDTNDLIAYYSPESVENLTESGATYQLSVSEAFAQYPENGKPNVDVYVVANVDSRRPPYQLPKESWKRL